MSTEPEKPSTTKHAAPTSLERLQRALDWERIARSTHNRADASRFRKLAARERFLAHTEVAA